MKTLREAVLELSGYRSREFYGASYTVKQNITMQDLLVRTNKVIQHEIDVTRHQLMRNDVRLILAIAAFCGAHTVRLDYIDGSTSRMVTAQTIVIATGTETTRDSHIPFDGCNIFTSDDVLKLDRLPRTLAVVGAGVIGCEYASIFAALGVRVTLIDQRHRLLPFVDAEIVDTLCYHMRENRVTLRLGESVSGIEAEKIANGSRVRLHLESGKNIIADSALLGWPDRRDDPAGACGVRLVLRSARPAQGRRALLRRGPRHIRGRRRDRVSGISIDLNGAGPGGCVPQLRHPGRKRPSVVAANGAGPGCIIEIVGHAQFSRPQWNCATIL